MEESEKKYFLGFSAFPGIGPHRFKLLLDYFGSAEKAWNGDKDTFLSVGLSKKLVDQFVEFRRNFSPKDYQSELIKKDITTLTIHDKLYPKLLKEIHDPPIILYIRGDVQRLTEMRVCIAVVGTRKMSTYGQTVTEKITQGLSQNGCTIVSGLAYGIDTVAHKTAIENSGWTIAVLGCGVDIIHPVTNTTLYWRIVKESGVVVSEYPPGRYAEKGTFPARNRIISGLSLAVVVTEGAENSGSLITAGFAAEQGREVFAVPGPINTINSQGPLKLMKDGAYVTTSAEDILTQLRISFHPQVMGKKGSEDAVEQKILELLSYEQLLFDTLVQRMGIPASKIAEVLTRMELNGAVKNENGVYQLT
ncbi:DNA-protecting protein DprA [Candidatus Gottesmanbacteria bacterium]|nr:DNA-protecting protein DprA [Candidatus Gottesmanbacteria bacterium]